MYQSIDSFHTLRVTKHEFSQIATVESELFVLLTIRPFDLLIDFGTSERYQRVTKDKTGVHQTLCLTVTIIDRNACNTQQLRHTRFTAT